MVVGMVFWGVVTGHVLGMVFRFDFIFSWRVLGQGEKFIALFLAREDFSPGATPPKTNENLTFFEGVNFLLGYGRGEKSSPNPSQIH